jgi:hypothetical protein
METIYHPPMLLALLLAILGPDYHAQPQCLVNLGCAAARWSGVPNPKSLPRCASPGPVLTVATALHQATTGWRRLFGWIWAPRVRIGAQLRSGGTLTSTMVMCGTTDLCCNRVSANLVLADNATGAELPVTTRTGRDALVDVLWGKSSCVGDSSRLCCEYEATSQVVADGRLVSDGHQHWHLEGATLCAT